MGGFDALWVWHDAALAERLGWYRAACDHGKKRCLKFGGVTFEKARAGAHLGIFPD